MEQGGVEGVTGTDDLEGRLERFEMLRGVSASDRRELTTSGLLRKLNRGDILIHQSAEAKSMYLLLDGRLGVHLDAVDNPPIASIDAGETVGELSLLTGERTSAYVVAEVGAEVLEVDEDTFWHLTNTSHGFALNLVVKLAGRLRANNATVSANVEQRRLYERAAMFDSLTGIHNRRWLDDTLSRMVRRHARGGASLSLALIDIDHFKRVNDSFGHEAGDYVLTEVAATMGRNLRPTDLFARFGGEEFVVLLPDTTLDAAEGAAARLREAVEELSLKMPDGRTLETVTVSIGVAALGKDQTSSALLKQADEAMYDAKRGGRNRVVVRR